MLGLRKYFIFSYQEKKITLPMIIFTKINLIN